MVNCIISFKIWADNFISIILLHSDQTGSENKFKSSRNSVLENSHMDVYQNLCCHKKHLRLESLKTLILADNALTKIQLSTDDITTFSETEETEWTNIGVTKLRLLYPNLSMLDISNNYLKVIERSISLHLQRIHKTKWENHSHFSLIAGSTAIFT